MLFCLAFSANVQVIVNPPYMVYYKTVDRSTVKGILFLDRCRLEATCVEGALTQWIHRETCRASYVAVHVVTVSQPSALLLLLCLL